MDVRIEGLVKEYSHFRALDEVSLQINSGMFGLLGPNGAGKTTLMRIITTLLSVTSGTVSVQGVDVMKDPAFVRQNLGYIPQEFGFYKNLNAYELLDYIAAMKGLNPKQRKQQITDLLEQVNLTADAKRRVGGYSGGMKQRLAIAQALLGDPKLIVVDEPTAGLDPEERIRFRNLLTRISGQRTIILSTHIVADIEASCSALAVLNQGRLIFHGTPDALVTRANGRVWELAIPSQDYDHISQQFKVISSRSLSDGQLQVRVIAHTSPLGIGEPAPAGLEEGYMAVIADHVQAVYS